MTSLYPGMLFYSSGLNKKSTPYGPEVTPSEIDQKLGRVAFNGRPWPKSSPVSTVYDVRNSSTRMIILNNKLSRKPKGSRLRGQTDYQGEIQHPEPFRHATEESHTNWEHHKSCTTSASKKFVPVFPRGVSPLPEWVNKTQRPPMKFDNGSGVNPNHHIQCQGHIDYDIVRWYNNHRRPRAQSRTSSMRESRAISPILNDPSLSKGEKRYLNSIAKIYSVDNMRQQKQHQYNQLMYQEMSKGLSRQADWQKYHRYLNTPRKTQFGPCDPKRSQSVAGKRSTKETTGDNRPHTTQTGARSTKESRGLSTSGSARSYNQKGQQNQKGGALKGRDDNKKRKNEDLTGKPARVESPLPLKPKRGDSLSSSLSSLSGGESDHENDATKGKAKESKTKEEEKQEELSPPQERGKRDDTGEDKAKKDGTDEKTKKSDSEDKRDGDDKKEDSDDDKRKEDDEDERSKMSARAEDDQPGRGVEYVPLYAERQGEENGDRSSANNNRKESTDRSQPEMPEHFRPKSPDGSKKKTSESENPVVLLPPTSKANGKTGSSDGEKSQDDDSNGPELIHHLHKEGGDRPLSRLGGRGQFTLVKKGSDANSDDDYSDDDEKDTVNNPVDQQRGGSHDNNGNENDNSTDVRLSLHKEDNATGGSDDGNTALTKDSPTGNSSQEKHSTITTVEY